jgi:hypothetical protein
MALSRRLGGHTLFICAAGLSIALAGLPGCGSSAGNAAQNEPALSSSGSASGSSSGSASGSALGAPSPSSSCTSSAFMHRTGHVRASQRATLTAALVPADVPDPGLDLDGPRPEDQENVLQQEQDQDEWASQGINSANDNHQTSQVGNSLQQESDAVAETEEVTLWEDDLDNPDSFGEEACTAIEALKKDAENLDNVDQMCTVIRQEATDAILDDVCGVIQDADSKFEQVFPCNDLDVTQWLLDMLANLFCKTAAPSG